MICSQCSVGEQFRIYDNQVYCADCWERLIPPLRRAEVERGEFLLACRNEDRLGVREQVRTRMTRDEIKRMQVLRDEGLSAHAIADRLGVGVKQVYFHTRVGKNHENPEIG